MTNRFTIYACPLKDLELKLNMLSITGGSNVKDQYYQVTIYDTEDIDIVISFHLIPFLFFLLFPFCVYGVVLNSNRYKPFDASFQFEHNDLSA